MNIQVGHDAALAESKKKLVSGTYVRNAWYVAAWSDDWPKASCSAAPS